MRLSICGSGMAAAAAVLALLSAMPNGELPPETIIQRFASNESLVKEALTHYTWRQTVKAAELTADGRPEGGQWNEVEDMLLVDGRRIGRPAAAPIMTMRHVQVTAEDIRDFSDPPQFLLTSETIGWYRVTYKGREKVDELGTYRFDVAPKKLAAGELYFQGTIWVEDRDLQIVKTSGKVTGRVAKNNQFPVFETYCEQIDGKNWFPTFRRADDTLHFPNGRSQRIRVTVQYQDYKRAD